jgi:hypothetical protein
MLEWKSISNGQTGIAHLLINIWCSEESRLSGSKYVLFFFQIAHIDIMLSFNRSIRDGIQPKISAQRLSFSNNLTFMKIYIYIDLILELKSKNKSNSSSDGFVIDEISENLRVILLKVKG